MGTSGSLFGPALPDGFIYRNDFLSVTEELRLATALAGVAFSDFEMRGVVARRRVAFFGHTYGREIAPPLPDFLLPLRLSVADWAGLDADTFAMALVNEYRPGSPIGWHRDAPQYGEVAGISLLSACRMRFRPYVAPGDAGAMRRGAQPGAARRTTHEIVLQPRSAYLMKGAARSSYEHHVPPVEALRYSITFRTLRPQPRQTQRR